MYTLASCRRGLTLVFLFVRIGTEFSRRTNGVRAQYLWWVFSRQVKLPAVLNASPVYFSIVERRFFVVNASGAALILLNVRTGISPSEHISGPINSRSRSLTRDNNNIYLCVRAKIAIVSLGRLFLSSLAALITIARARLAPFSTRHTVFPGKLILFRTRRENVFVRLQPLFLS